MRNATVVIEGFTIVRPGIKRNSTVTVIKGVDDSRWRRDLAYVMVFETSGDAHAWADRAGLTHFEVVPVSTTIEVKA
jgi:hypothetical protein